MEFLTGAVYFMSLQLEVNQLLSSLDYTHTPHNIIYIPTPKMITSLTHKGNKVHTYGLSSYSVLVRCKEM